MSQTIDALQWRYAVKKYNPEKKISEKDFSVLKESLRLSPSSFGLQPSHFIIVENEDIRKKLRLAGYDQSPITDASHLIILATKKNIDANLVDEYMRNIAHTRGISLESLEGFRRTLNGAISMKGEAGAKEWAIHQTYIALGVLLTTAATLNIDATPMEGFDPKQYDEILGLHERGLTSSVMVTLGFRSDDDAYAKETKVRFSENELYTRV